MRILHTSDWHLGRTFGPLSLAADQAAFVDWLVDVCRKEAVDLVVIAGDVYDRAVAPVDAVVLFRDALTRIVDTGAQVAVISGNHDAADRVAAYDRLLDRSGVVVRGGYGRIGDVTRLEFADGPLDLVLLPYLDPRSAPDEYAVDATAEAGMLALDVPDAGSGVAPADGGSAEQLVGRRFRRTHQSVLAPAVRAASAAVTAPRSIAVAHAFVVGGRESESERPLTVGGTATVDMGLFRGFSYTALGHLHRPQTVGEWIGPMRYAGSPLAYSFSEDHRKSVTLVDMDADGSVRVEELTIPVGRRVATIRGTMLELLEPLRFIDCHESFVRAIVTDRETVLDAKARLAELYPYVTEIRLMPLGHEGVARVGGPTSDDVSPFDAALQFWTEAEGTPPDDETTALLVDVVDTVMARGRA